MMSNTPRFVFFGTPGFATIILDELERAGYLPALIVTAPDKPSGRKLIVTPSEAKTWALAHGIPVSTPEKIRENKEFFKTVKQIGAEFFVVAAYGKIIPKQLLDIPPKGVLNVHPSLLPKFRGPSPVESAILSGERETGATIMLLDEEMDHGPLLAQKKLPGVNLDIEHLPRGGELEEALAHLGGVLLTETIPLWITGEIAPVPQDHARATYTKKITKEDGAIDLGGDPEKNYRKIRAFDPWPGTYFFAERGGKKTRVRIADARLEGGTLVITRVVPEGKREMPYEDFLRGGATNSGQTHYSR